MKTNQALEYYEGAIDAVGYLLNAFALENELSRKEAGAIIDLCKAEIANKHLELNSLAARLEACAP